ncbi:MAG TPA: hypothetical protein VK458_04035 [Myxococcaceae bacterium]|nr:hypothetical protein [Myxococcaceae bacterium]
MAGTIGGATWGVAKDVRLHSVRVLGCAGDPVPWSTTAEYDAANQRVRFLLPFLGNGTICVPRLVSTEGSTERVLFEVPFSTSRRGGTRTRGCRSSPTATIPATTRVSSG